MADIINDLLSLQYSENFMIDGIQEENVDLYLPTAPAQTAVLYGTVTDSGVPVPDATIKIFDAAGHPYRHTLTDAAGAYTFSDVPAGTYSVGAVAEGYRLSDLQQVTLSESDTTSVEFNLAKDTTLALGAIAGVVSSVLPAGGTMPVAGARITLRDSLGAAAAVTYAAADGEFVFYDVADGIYSILASADGYATATVLAVTITAGSIANVTITMHIDTRVYSGTVSGIVKNKSGYAMAGCFVGLYQIKDNGMGGTTETLVATTKTNAAGQYLFGTVGSGTYIVKAKMNA